MKLSERIPHDQRCPVAKYKSDECTCYVSEVAQLEVENEALEKTRIDLCVMLKEWMAFIHKERLGELHRKTNEILERNMSGKETPCP